MTPPDESRSASGDATLERIGLTAIIAALFGAVVVGAYLAGQRDASEGCTAAMLRATYEQGRLP